MPPPCPVSPARPVTVHFPLFCSRWYFIDMPWASLPPVGVMVTVASAWSLPVISTFLSDTFIALGTSKPFDWRYSTTP